MIRIDSGQMQAVYRDLSDISVQIRRTESELEEIRRWLKKQEPMDEVAHKLSGMDERLNQHRRQIQLLSMALETITDTYVRTEDSIGQMMDGDARNTVYREQPELGVINLESVGRRLDELKRL